MALYNKVMFFTTTCYSSDYYYDLYYGDYDDKDYKAPGRMHLSDMIYHSLTYSYLSVCIHMCMCVRFVYVSLL